MEIGFIREDSGDTRVNLISSGWDCWGPKAHRARRGYSVGWAYILNIWAGRRTVRMGILDAVIATMNLVQKFRGGVDAEIKRAGGEIPRALSPGRAEQ